MRLLISAATSRTSTGARTTSPARCRRATTRVPTRRHSLSTGPRQDCAPRHRLRSTQAQAVASRTASFHYREQNTAYADRNTSIAISCLFFSSSAKACTYLARHVNTTFSLSVKAPSLPSSSPHICRASSARPILICTYPFGTTPRRQNLNL